MNGYYSEQQARQTRQGKVGYCIYTKPDGEYAICTVVGEQPPNFPDVIDHGPVVNCVYDYASPFYPTDDPRVDQEKFRRVFNATMGINKLVGS